VQERLQKEVFQSEIFEAVFQKTPRQSLTDRVTPISADMLLENLGLSPADRLTLINQVEVIIHCASST